MSTQRPSYLFLNSTTAKLGIKPLDNIGKLNMQDYELVTLRTCPIIYNNELYIPVDFAAKASGISSNSIVSMENVLIINGDKHKTIVVDGNKKTVNVDGETINVANMLIKNKTIMLPEKYIHDMFGLEMKQSGNIIILCY